MSAVLKIKNTCKLSFLTSFCIGSMLLILFALTKDFEPFAIMGIYYLYIAFAVNLILFIGVVISALYFWDNRLELFGHAMLLTLNIPIAIGYFFIVLALIDS